MKLYGEMFLGFFSDLFGYKLVLSWNMIVICLAWTSYNFIPVYREGPSKVPFINYTTNGSELVSLQWPICDSGDEDITSSDVRTPVFSGFGRSRVFFGEHRAVRVFFYRTSGGPGFQQSQNSGGRANFSSNNQST